MFYQVVNNELLSREAILGSNEFSKLYWLTESVLLTHSTDTVFIIDIDTSTFLQQINIREYFHTGPHVNIVHVQVDRQCQEVMALLSDQQIVRFGRRAGDATLVDCEMMKVNNGNSGILHKSKLAIDVS
jgi:hypothetical protein